MRNVDNPNPYTDIALTEVFVKNPNEAKTTQDILHRRKGLNMRKYNTKKQEDTKKVVHKKQTQNIQYVKNKIMNSFHFFLQYCYLLMRFLQLLHQSMLQ